MTRHEEGIRLRHMLDYAKEAIAMAAGRKRQDLDSDRMLQLSLTHLVEIIGEAAGHIGEETCQRNPSIPWPRVVGMRNRLIHGYDTVDLDVLWDTVVDDLPGLVIALEGVLRIRE